MSFKENSIEWNNALLGDICTIKGGKRLPKGKQLSSNKTKHPYIKVKDMGENKYICLNSGFEYLDDETFESISRYIVNENDLIISIVGTIGLIGLIDKSLESANLTENCVKLIDIKNVTNDFLYYYLKSPIGGYEIKKGVVGSTQPKLPIYNIQKIAISYPSISEQKAIAKVLSDLDEKIETNNKINKKLEEMAQAIFKQWFIDFEFPNEDGKPYKSSGGEMSESEQGMIPKGWEYKKLDDVLNTIEAGNRPKGGAGNLTEGIPSIGAENIIGLGKYDYSKEKFVTEDYFNSMKKGIVQSKDVLLYKDGAQLGRKTMFMDGFPHEKCCINSHVFILRSNNSISQSYLYFWLDQDYMTQNIINLNANSAQPGINQIQVKSLNILVPTKEIIEKFELTVNSLLDKLFVNCKENTKLANIRDTLLPKLMSGEIRVPID